MIRKIVAILFVAFILSGSSAQNIIDLQCGFFFEYPSGEYGCQLSRVNVTDNTATYRIVGNHLGNLTNNDVEIFEVYNSDFRFIPQEIFTTFPNIDTMKVYDSNLQSINVSGTNNLRILYLNGNNISTINNGTFETLVNLTTLVMNRNGISTLEENAFIGLTNLSRLTLISNNITTLPTQVFQHLQLLRILDLDQNQLTRIEHEVFANLTNLRNLYLEANRIEAISPSFTRSLRENIIFINLNRNICIDFFGYFNDDFDWARFNMEINECYENYTQRNENDERRLSMEFTGRLNIYDRFNNLIGVINNNNNNGSE
jgi:hypothetical protein